MPKPKEQNQDIKLIKDVMSEKDIPTVSEANQEMSLYDYERKYVRQENVTRAKFILYVAASLIGIIIFTCLAVLTMNFWDKNMYVGIAALVISIFIFVFCYIVPLVKILRSDYFVTNVDHNNVKAAKKHNRDLRKKLAFKMVDFSKSVDGIGWCKDSTVTDLQLALQEDNNEKIKENLTKLYQGPVKRDAKKIIRRKSLKSGLFTAVSQEEKADAVILATLNFQLVRDLVYLYGFRPSDAKLLRVFTAVLENVLIVYGINKVQIGEKILSTVNKVPFVSLFSMLIDSGIQGLTSGLLTLRIGYQTIHYLNKEYRLQAILDGISIDVDVNEEQSEELTLKDEYEEEKKLHSLKA